MLDMSSVLIYYVRTLSPSSSGLGHRPLTAVTWVQIPSGTPPKIAKNLGLCMISVRPVFYLFGCFLVIMGVLMSIPLAIDLANNEDSWGFFLNSMVTTIFTGGFLIAATRRSTKTAIHPKELILSVCMFWVLSPIFAALPLIYSSLPYSFFDCYFEAISAMSTTGATIIYSFNSVSHGLMIWRAIIEIIGACSYIISSYSVIKIVYAQGKLDNSDSILYIPKYKHSILEYIAALLCVIACGTFAIAVACNKDIFESFFIASSVLTTTGVPYTELFDTNKLLYIVSLLMLVSGLPLYDIIKWKKALSFNNIQIKVYFGLFAIVALLSFNDSIGFLHCLTSAASIISTNNISIDSGSTCFIFSFIGGCAGSSSGGIKVIRIIVIFLALQKTLKEAVYSNTQIVPAKSLITCEQGLMRSVLAYFSCLILIIICIAIGLCSMNISFANAIFYSCSAITNSAVLSANGPASALDIMAMAPSSKLLISAAMILGRLEIFPLFAIISPKFWRK